MTIINENPTHPSKSLPPETAPELAEVLSSVFNDRELREILAQASRDVIRGLAGALQRHRAKDAVVAYSVRLLATYRASRA